ncbi:YkgJ family cysteine cluster protein [Candidatus Omnitrophota bacterium]
MANGKKITHEELLEICTTCANGSCCQDGVEVDLEQAKTISKLNINLKKPWFEGLIEDNDVPSGWGISTVVRDGRCVFQRKNHLCMIYKHRPIFCRDFPMEKGQIAEFYSYLCEKPSSLKRKAERDLKGNSKK